MFARDSCTKHLCCNYGKSATDHLFDTIAGHSDSSTHSELSSNSSAEEIMQ